MMHGARTALNRDPEIRAWAEEYLKERTRAVNTHMTEDEFEQYWRYHKPEIIHEGATEAIEAYKKRDR
jgi:hypothetical protein